MPTPMTAFAARPTHTDCSCTATPTTATPTVITATATTSRAPTRPSAAAWPRAARRSTPRARRRWRRWRSEDESPRAGRPGEPRRQVAVPDRRGPEDPRRRDEHHPCEPTVSGARDPQLPPPRTRQAAGAVRLGRAPDDDREGERDGDVHEERQHLGDRAPLGDESGDERTGTGAERERERGARAPAPASARGSWRPCDSSLTQLLPRHRDAHREPGEQPPGHQEAGAERSEGEQGTADDRRADADEHERAAPVPVGQRPRDEQGGRETEHVDAQEDVHDERRVVGTLLVHEQQRRELVAAPGADEDGAPHRDPGQRPGAGDGDGAGGGDAPRRGAHRAPRCEATCARSTSA